MDKDAARGATSTHLRSTRVEYGSKGAVKRGRSLLSGVILATLITCLMMPLAGCGGEPSESLTESLIAFSRNDQIWTARGDGTEQKQLTDGIDALPAVSPDGKTIVYQHREGNPDEYCGGPPLPIGIYSIPSEGGTPRLLTPSSWLTGSGWTPLLPWDEDRKWIMRNCTQPSFSPDGKSICFLMLDEDYVEPPEGSGPDPSSYFQGIAIMNADGTGEPRIILTHDPGPQGERRMSSPRFSTDGKEIYVAYSSLGIDKVPVTGGDLTQILPERKKTRTPSDDYDSFCYISFGVSPVMGQIAVVEEWGTVNRSPSQPPYQKRIQLMRLDTQEMRLIYPQQKMSSPSVGPGPLSFTPSGTSIAFVCYECIQPDDPYSLTPHIYVVPVEGGKPKKIITDGDQPCFGTGTAGGLDQ